ncbi:aminotransferase [Mycotypha africana]|uniref:aminotransferase n=1 Tax=Mycotypha africana TaxID=64632 RepID=UPI002301BBC3|nr:aminotransferase [Mycotypha africana]KAI8982023.1 aminotransferase [Mycotypha africana]
MWAITQYEHPLHTPLESRSHKADLPLLSIYFHIPLYSIIVIVEQLNVDENDLSKIKYSFNMGTTDFDGFILSRPSGAYTGMRTVDKTSIAELHTHMKRLYNSIASIKFEGDNNGDDSAVFLEEKHKEVQEAMAPLRDPVLLEKKVVQIVRVGLTEFYGKVHLTTDGEVKVTILATYCFDTHKPYFAAHFECLPPIASANERAQILVEKQCRKAPEIKDSQWVRDRQELEHKKKAIHFNEVVLIDDKLQLYEGISSNFLVVKDNVVYCAPLDHVLLGTMLKLVIGICEKHDIPLRWDFPRLQEVDTWEGCFLTSTSRVLLQVETVWVNGQTYEFRNKCKLIQFIREQMSRELYESAVKVM